jgi:hypothetical protein
LTQVNDFSERRANAVNMNHQNKTSLWANLPQTLCGRPQQTFMVSKYDLILKPNLGASLLIEGT